MKANPNNKYQCPDCHINLTRYTKEEYDQRSIVFICDLCRYRFFPDAHTAKLKHIPLLGKELEEDLEFNVWYDHHYGEFGEMIVVPLYPAAQKLMDFAYIEEIKYAKS